MNISIYQSAELPFCSARPYEAAERPWKTVQFSADFTSEKGTKLTIPGFWDGGNTFRLRFAPTEMGGWRYVTYSSLPELDGQEGAFTVTAAQGENPLFVHGGFLKASDNGRYITYTDGEPFFLLSDTLWFIPGTVKMPMPVLQRCLAKRRSQGFSAIVIGMIEGAPGIQIQQRYHQTGDITLSYWRTADESIRAIIDSGMAVFVQPMWAGGSDWPDDSEWQDILDYMTARYAAWPLHFGMGPEFDSPPKQESGLDERSLALLGYVRGRDPYQRATITQPHPWNIGATRKNWFCPAVDLLALEGGHENPWGITTTFYREAWDFQLNGRHKPLMLMETTWEGISRHQFPPHDAYTIRYNLCRAFLSGCTGLSYGANGLWYPRTSEDDDVYDRDWGESPTWDVALEYPGADCAANIKRLFEALPWWNIRPLFGCGEPSVDILPPYPVEETPEIMPQKTRTNQIVPFPEEKDDYRRPVFAALNGVIAGYIPRCRAKDSVLHAELPAGEYLTRWYSPCTGSYVEAGVVHVGEGSTLLPVRPDNEDWILLLDGSSAE